MITLQELQEMVAAGTILTGVRRSVTKINKTLVQLAGEMDDLNFILGAVAKLEKPKPKTEKKDHPQEDTAPAKLCEHMGATPKTAAAIAKAVGCSEATIKLYLNKFLCFSNVRGKGYTYTPLPTTTTKKKTTKKKSKKKT